MEVILQIGRKNFRADLSKPLDISIPLSNQGGPRAFHAEGFKAVPFTSGEFTGSLESGAPVNFYDLTINPHGNGTHTESLLHIDRRGQTINRTLSSFHFTARLVTTRPVGKDEGDQVIGLAEAEGLIRNVPGVQALIMRTLPNEKSKLNRNYSGTNPPYLTYDLMRRIREEGYEHFLTDLPSVDREQDNGALLSHKAFWNTNTRPEMNKTITEMIYVNRDIEDGLYLLNLQIISVEGDASPSKPVLYKLIESEVLE